MVRLLTGAALRSLKAVSFATIVKRPFVIREYCELELVHRRECPETLQRGWIDDCGIPFSCEKSIRKRICSSLRFKTTLLQPRHIPASNLPNRLGFTLQHSRVQPCHQETRLLRITSHEYVLTRTANTLQLVSEVVKFLLPNNFQTYQPFP